MIMFPNLLALFSYLNFKLSQSQPPLAMLTNHVAYSHLGYKKSNELLDGWMNSDTETPFSILIILIFAFILSHMS